jgi:hypothetical protein
MPTTKRSRVTTGSQLERRCTIKLSASETVADTETLVTSLDMASCTRSSCTGLSPVDARIAMP